ncbi:PREDICTED: saccharopine dehydrogenase-like oxidoreductase [Amphimedon queenslandica]|uniref:Saccharopine dehydrogenase NADP binding domain-containing protein n=1 Tax=Amphimedon queenslandica TaxID=400682 RepID=A0A1X7TUG5_AMPQE|nr:PREDICTED: saccharopine dehydrogenase-like oxidoreductase [Amphimedon queenslandica]|eukprot:XP_003389768.1 PREDICTED: saccharopine dehydrogenase-like oxidoreductase [Amphimedon queenslandica]
MASTREFDFVLFGATGFTGKYVAEELDRIQKEGKRSFKWAAAGRNEERVKEALEGLGIVGVTTISANINDEESLKEMCGRCSVLLDVVGPYVLYGEAVVKACINQGTDYIDITGETYYIESMVDKYDALAKEKGVYLVNCCGFDVIPNDIGSLVLQKGFNGQLAYIESYVSTNGKGLNTGTWESAIRSIRSYKKLAELRKKASSSRPPLPLVKMPKRRTIFFSDVTQSWCGPFPGADRACMLRSAGYRHKTDGLPMFQVKTYASIGSLWKTLMLIIGFMIIIPMSLTGFGAKLLLKYPGLFSAGLARKGGPSRSEVEKGTFTVVLQGSGYSPDNEEKVKPDAFLRVRVRGAEPGYIATSAMMVQSGFCLLNERSKLPKDGGFYTPGAAFGKTDIVQNLEQTGKLKFTIEQV